MEKWTDEQDQAIKEMAASRRPDGIATELNKLFGTERTYDAVKMRASVIGVALTCSRGEGHGLAKYSNKAVRMFRSLSACGYGLSDIKRELGLDISLPGLRAILAGESRTVESDCMADVVAQYELEIKVLKEQYVQLQKHKGCVDTVVREVFTDVCKRVRILLKRADYAYVYWDPVLKKFSVVKTAPASERQAESMQGVYSEGVTTDDLRYDLFELIDDAYRKL